MSGPVLWVAAENGDIDTMRREIEAGANVNYGVLEWHYSTEATSQAHSTTRQPY